MLIVSLLAAPSLVLAAAWAEQRRGTAAGGWVTALPVAVVVSRSGAAPGVHALAGLVRSLPCYLTFCVLAAVALPLVGAAGVPLALVGCLAAGSVSWRALPAVAPAASPA